MPTILVADNRKAFVALAKLMLERAGYTVVTAGSPADASEILSKGGCDAAVLDYRLKDDTDLDRSGLEVAEKADPNIPKIFVSAEVKKEDVMAAVQVGRDGRPIAVRFLAKSEVERKLTDTVREALEIGKQWNRQSRERINPELYRDYRRTALGGLIQDIVHIVASVAFVFLMVWGAVELHELHGGIVETALMITAVVVGEIANLLLARRGEGWKERVEKYHQELLQADRYEHLLASCESLPDSVAIARVKESVILRQSEKWIGTPARTSQEA